MKKSWINNPEVMVLDVKMTEHNLGKSGGDSFFSGKHGEVVIDGRVIDVGASNGTILQS